MDVNMNMNIQVLPDQGNGGAALSSLCAKGMLPWRAFAGNVDDDAYDEIKPIVLRIL
jgi:hypothetical protein